MLHLRLNLLNVLFVCILAFVVPNTELLLKTGSCAVHNAHDNCTSIDYEQQLKSYDYLIACVKKGSNLLHVSSDESCGKDSKVATGRFRNAVNKTGWGILEVETYSGFDDTTQAFAAGLVEGALTRQLITYHVHNTVEGMCDGQRKFCKKLFHYLSRNLKWIEVTVNQKAQRDKYWKQVKLIFAQLTGMNYGYLKKAGKLYKPTVAFEMTSIYMIQLAGDLIDLVRIFGKTEMEVKAGHCSGFVKVTPGNNDLFFAHVTMSGYNTMNRILKFYKFAFDQQEVPGFALSFSAYGGSLGSLDDFILASSGLAVMETTFAIFNESLYRMIKPVGQLHSWVRSIIATRLANTAKEWMNIFAQYNSGTYNNQWSVVDYKLFEPKKELPPNDVLWVLEQTPELVIFRDLTLFLKNHTYWPSYNIPYFKEISDISGYKLKAKSLDWYKWGSSPRAKIFNRDHRKVVDIDSLRKLMRYNDYTHDEFSRCKCVPPYTAEGGISTRGDLNPANGTYELESMGHRNHGGIDYKGTNYELFRKLRFRAWGGPTYDPLPVFSWATTDIKARHHGQPTVWQFDEIETTWETIM